jgi:hypothetical protein
MSTKVAGKKLKPRHVTKFNIPCGFNGDVSEVAVFIGNPEPKHSPIYFQSKFIQDARGGVIPSSVLEGLEKLQKLAVENGVPFEELCRYALGSIASDSDSTSGEQQALDNSASVVQSEAAAPGASEITSTQDATEGNAEVQSEAAAPGASEITSTQDATEGNAEVQSEAVKSGASEVPNTQDATEGNAEVQSEAVKSGDAEVPNTQDATEDTNK